MKEIKDYLHLYLGCEVVAYKSQTASLLIGFDCKRGWAKIDSGNNEYEASAENIQLILRPLSDMTKEELKELYNFNYFYGNHAAPHEITKIVLKPNMSGHLPNIIEISYSGKVGGTGYHSGQDILYLNKLSSEQHMYLLSKHFDLFQLIESGLAIDKTKT